MVEKSFDGHKIERLTPAESEWKFYFPFLAFFSVPMMQSKSAHSGLSGVKNLFSTFFQYEMLVAP